MGRARARGHAGGRRAREGPGPDDRRLRTHAAGGCRGERHPPGAGRY